jgi:hypothetical protein
MGVRKAAHKIRAAIYYRANTEKVKRQTAVSHKSNPEKCRAWRSKWSKVNRKKLNTKMRSQRRALGYIFLNKPFKGADGHHVDKTHVLFIPRVLHGSVSHDIWTGKNMDTINALALTWLEHA